MVGSSTATDGSTAVIIWRPGQGPRLIGYGTILLASLVIAILVYAISGGNCVLFVAP
jgi:hypothetical protein